MMSRRMLPALAAALTGVVLLGGCATTPPGGATAPTAPASGAPTTAVSHPATADPSTAVETEDASHNTAARLAIETAEDTLGGRATRLEWAGNLWKADVVVGEATHGVEIAAAGDKVTKDAVTAQKMPADQVDKLTEAFVTLRQAVDTVLDQVPGDFRKAELLPDSAPATGMRWDVSVEVDKELVALTVDATSGDVRE